MASSRIFQLPREWQHRRVMATMDPWRFSSFFHPSHSIRPGFTSLGQFRRALLTRICLRSRLKIASHTVRWASLWDGSSCKSRRETSKKTWFLGVSVFLADGITKWLDWIALICKMMKFRTNMWSFVEQRPVCLYQNTSPSYPSCNAGLFWDSYLCHGT